MSLSLTPLLLGGAGVQCYPVSSLASSLVLPKMAQGLLECIHPPLPMLRPYFSDIFLKPQILCILPDQSSPRCSSLTLDPHNQLTWHELISPGSHRTLCPHTGSCALLMIPGCPDYDFFWLSSLWGPANFITFLPGWPGTLDC